MAKKKVTALVKLQCRRVKRLPLRLLDPLSVRTASALPSSCSSSTTARREWKAGLIIPVIITVYNDKSFTFILKTPPASSLSRKAAGIEKARLSRTRRKSASSRRAKLEEIAKLKMPDLNAVDLEGAKRIHRRYRALHGPSRWRSRMKHGKKYLASVKKVRSSGFVRASQAAELIKELAFAKFDETVDVSVKLNLKKSQTVRDTVFLPHQFRGEKKILVFCKGEKEKEAQEAGSRVRRLRRAHREG